MADLRVVAGEGVDRPSAAEFFCGIGLARLGLEAAGFEVVWANDMDRQKRDMYQENFTSSSRHEFVFGDVGKVKGQHLPKGLALAWASSPCTDLSLAGGRGGLDGEESRTFWDWTRALGEMGEDRPRVAVLENVTGLATSDGGEDLRAAIAELNELDYSVDVITLDARRFVPQSRPRLFLIATTDPPEDDPQPVSDLRPDWLQDVFLDQTLRTHRAKLPSPPPLLTSGLTQLIERLPDDDARWWSSEETAKLVASLSPEQAQRLQRLRSGEVMTPRTAYRRTRDRKPVWEIRSDDIAGCLRAVRGGSSKQALVEAGRGTVRARWMTPREYARLMGAGDYELAGTRVVQALYGFGDAVCVPAVAWLAEHYLMPLVSGQFAGRTDSLPAAAGA